MGEILRASLTKSHRHRRQRFYTATVPFVNPQPNPAGKQYTAKVQVEQGTKFLITDISGSYSVERTVAGQVTRFGLRPPQSGAFQMQYERVNASYRYSRLPIIGAAITQPLNAQYELDDYPLLLDNEIFLFTFTLVNSSILADGSVTGVSFEGVLSGIEYR